MSRITSFFLQVVELDLSEDGLNFSNFWEEGYCFGSSVIMLAVDIVLYALLAYYFDNVIPGTVREECGGHFRKDRSKKDSDYQMKCGFLFEQESTVERGHRGSF